MPCLILPVGPNSRWTLAGKLPLPANAVDLGNGTLVISNILEGSKTRYCCDVKNNRGAATNCTIITILGKYTLVLVSKLAMRAQKKV